MCDRRFSLAVSVPLCCFSLVVLSPATAASLSIVDRFLNDMVPPIAEEGFSRVHVLQRSDDPAVQQQHVEELLVAVQSPPPAVQP